MVTVCQPTPSANRADLLPVGPAAVVRVLGVHSGFGASMMAGARAELVGVAQPGARGADARRHGGEAAVGRMRSHLVVVQPPALDHSAGLGQAGEYLLVEMG